jgi:hypothetical protein
MAMGMRDGIASLGQKTGKNACFLPVFPAKTGLLVYLYATWIYDSKRTFRMICA